MRVISSFSLGENITLEGQDDGVFSHDDADVTMITYLLQAAEHNQVIRILSDDTDVLIILISWVWKVQLHHTCRVQME